MKEFITDEYLTAKKELTELVNDVNTTLKHLDKTVLKAIEGKTLSQILWTDISLDIKTEKVQHVPAFQELLNVGVDLRKQVILSDTEKESIDSITAQLNQYQNSYVQYAAYLNMIDVIKGKAALNKPGLHHIESQKIILNKQELELWNRIQSVREYIVKEYDRFLLYPIFGETLINRFSQSETIPLRVFKNMMKNHNSSFKN